MWHQILYSGRRWCLSPRHSLFLLAMNTSYSPSNLFATPGDIVIDATSGTRGIVIDLDTGLVIRKVRRANLSSGEFEAFRTWPNGEIRYDENGPMIYRGRGRLHFKPTANLAPPRPTSPSQTQQNYDHIPIPLFSNRCCQKGCTRVARWSVSDEVPQTPVEVNGRKYSRGKIVGRRYYCEFHWKPPRLLDAKGEVMQEFDEIGVRPT